VENGQKTLRECGLAVRRASSEPLKNVGVAALSRRLAECLHLDDERLGALFVILCTSLGLSCDPCYGLAGAAAERLLDVAECLPYGLDVTWI